MLDNQLKSRKLGYKGNTGQTIKKTEAALPESLTNKVKKIGEIRRTSDSDISRTTQSGDTTNALNVVTSRFTEINGIRKDIVSHEKRRRLSLMDEKDLHLAGIYHYFENTSKTKRKKGCAFIR